MGFSFLLAVCDRAIVAPTELSPPSPQSFPPCASHRLVAPLRAGGGEVRDGAAILGGQVLQFLGCIQPSSVQVNKITKSLMAFSLQASPKTGVAVSAVSLLRSALPLHEVSADCIIPSLTRTEREECLELEVSSYHSSQIFN